MRRRSVVICTDRVVERRDRLIDHSRVDQRLVALHVDDQLAVERDGDFGQPIGAAAMGGAGHPDFAAERLDRSSDPHVVGRDDDRVDRSGRRGASYTCSIIGRPSMSARALPGKRVDSYRAGMMATMRRK